MNDADPDAGYLPLHRSEALTDGIFAVAMTLLVIELKLLDNGIVHSAGGPAEALAGLIPKAVSWTPSFFVLALFWIGHHRAFAFVPVPVPGNMAFMLMAVISPMSRAIERRGLATGAVASSARAGR